MKAEEMFEKLGYEKKEYNEFLFMWIKTSDPENTISFYLKSKSFNYDHCGHSVAVSIPLLEAIIQQCKELGWL